MIDEPYGMAVFLAVAESKGFRATTSARSRSAGSHHLRSARSSTILAG